MKSNRFTCTYEVEDGFVCGRRPHSFYATEDDIKDDMREADLRELYREMVEADFTLNIHPCGENEDEFVEWALGVIEWEKNED